MRKNYYLKASIALGLIFAFLANNVGPISTANAEPIYGVGGKFQLPAPGTLVHLSPAFNPPVLKGIKVHPEDPFRFDFILDQGDENNSHPERSEGSQQEQLKQQATRLIKYFLASLTIPENDLWVNLSPYEKNRIVPESFGQTEMGRDLLAEDYMLKQITASLIYPEDEIGKRFWKRVYQEAEERFGTTNIPVNTFNKVWIVPEKAIVYENAKAGTAYVVESKLRVMLEQDYLALEKNTVIQKNTVILSEAKDLNKINSLKDSSAAPQNDVNKLGFQVVREIVLPELTEEVNEGENFAQLRQVYNSLILATWYKKKIRDSILAQVYEDKKKIAGVQYTNSVIARSAVQRSPKGDTAISDTEKIYQRYLQAFKKGSYNYIKEEQDPITQQIIPRKYFSGGLDLAMGISHYGFQSGAFKIITDPAMMKGQSDNAVIVQIRTDLAANLASKLKSALNVPKIRRKSIINFIMASVLSLQTFPFSATPLLAQNIAYTPTLTSGSQTQLSDQQARSLISAALSESTPREERLKAIDIIAKTQPYKLLEDKTLSEVLSVNDIYVLRDMVFHLNSLIAADPLNEDRIREFFNSNPDRLSPIKEDASNYHLQYEQDFLDTISELGANINSMLLSDHFQQNDEVVLMSYGKDRPYILKMIFRNANFQEENQWFYDLMQKKEWADAVVQMAVTTDQQAPQNQVNAIQGLKFARPDLLLFDDKTLSRLLTESDENVRDAMMDAIRYAVNPPSDALYTYDIGRDEKFREFFGRYPSLLEPFKSEDRTDEASDFLAIINKDTNYILSLFRKWHLKKLFELERIEIVARHLLFINSNEDFENFQADFLSHLISYMEKNVSTLDKDLMDDLDLLKRSREAGITNALRIPKETLRKILVGRENKTKDKVRFQKYSDAYIQFRANEFTQVQELQLIGDIEHSTGFKRPAGIDAIAWLNNLLENPVFQSVLFEKFLENQKKRELKQEDSPLIKPIFDSRAKKGQLGPEKTRTLLELVYPRSPKRKYFVVFLPSADRNDAFFFTDFISDAFDNHQRVLVYQIGSKDDWMNAAEDLADRGGKIVVFVPSAHSGPGVMQFGLNDPQRGIPLSYGNKEEDNRHELTVYDEEFFKRFFSKVKMSQNSWVIINGCSAGRIVKTENGPQQNIFNLFLKTLKRQGIKAEIKARKDDGVSYFIFKYDSNERLIGVDIIKSAKPEIIEKESRNNQNFKNNNYANLNGPMFFTVDPSVSISFNWSPNHPDAAMKGGIDLTPANMHLQTQNAGETIKFHLNPAQLVQLQNAPGFVPVIINIQPMTDLKKFLDSP